MIIPADAALAHDAQRGDLASLGALLAQHRAGMLKVALSVLRRPDDAEDAVQDAALTALARIGDLRDPAAAGPWLRMITRNVCRMRLRKPYELPADQLLSIPAPRADPQELLAEHALRDEVWHALGQLPLPLRTVTMLRYFTDVTRYDEIALLCGIPVGTVRSRLSEGRRKLASSLLAARHRSYDGLQAYTDARRREAEQAVEAGHAGTFGAVLREGWTSDVDTRWADGRRLRGIEAVARYMDESMAAGVRQRLAGVVASPGVTIWEMQVSNPAGSGMPCPAYTLWLLSYDQGRVAGMRLFSRAA